LSAFSATAVPSVSDVELGVGDDGALLRSPSARTWSPPSTPWSPECTSCRRPSRLLNRASRTRDQPERPCGDGGHSGLGALALTLPEADERWLEGIRARASVRLPLRTMWRSWAVIPPRARYASPCSSSATCRANVRCVAPVAARGMTLFLSGTAGDAAAGLLLEQGRLTLEDSGAAQELRARFAFPTARVALGEALRGHASACIDISDGLLGDAAKLAAASGCGVEIALDELPLSHRTRARGRRGAGVAPCADRGRRL
jgi:thiamine-monophosphate kinase